MAEIGPIRRKIDLEPLPETAPVQEPSPQPVKVPSRV